MDRFILFFILMLIYARWALNSEYHTSILDGLVKFVDYFDINK